MKILNVLITILVGLSIILIFLGSGISPIPLILGLMLLAIVLLLIPGIKLIIGSKNKNIFAIGKITGYIIILLFIILEIYLVIAFIQGIKYPMGPPKYSQSPAECKSVALKILEINGQPQVSFGGYGSQGFIEFVLDNIGLKRVERIRVTVLAEKGTYTYLTDLDESIEPSIQIKKRIPYDYTFYGQPSQITWTPIVYDKNNELVVCESGKYTYMS